MGVDMLDAAMIRRHVERILRFADMRRLFGDDEHRDPLPIHGSARMYDRIPLAIRRDMDADFYRFDAVRERMSKGSDWLDHGINPEEGA